MTVPVAAAAAPPVSATGMALASGLGSVVSGLFGRNSAKSSMRFQKEAAQNAHQWEVNDLIAAGLNPILSGTGGGGARPSGGAQSTMPDLGQAASSALAARRMNQEIKNLEATELQIKAQTIGIEQANKLKSGPADIGGDFGDLYNAFKGSVKQNYEKGKKRHSELLKSYQDMINKRKFNSPYNVIEISSKENTAYVKWLGKRKSSAYAYSQFLKQYRGK